MKVTVFSIIDDSTFKCISSTYKKHPKYGKYITKHKKFLVDSAGTSVSIGQEVEVVASRPISKSKRWILKK